MRKLFCLLFFVSFLRISANEGMWIPGSLDKQTRLWMTELGLELPFNSVYNEAFPSLKDAIVSFGGFCSGVVVSDEGLILTNHHCGFEAVQQHSTVENNYLRDGFCAFTRQDELPSSDLFVSFLISTEDVTERILKEINFVESEIERNAVIDSMSILIQSEYYAKDSLLRYIVSSYYGGNEFYLTAYKDYTDIRLVYAPPSSIGKFGGDTDNWVWPRHTGDFAMFRIYADSDNQPATHSLENVPYKPEYVVPISLNGYQEGDFCMTLGYPGFTERYLSSYGVVDKVNTENAAMINVRGIKQAIWKERMEHNDSIRIKYANKYAVSSNYWKHSIGMNMSINELNVVEEKQGIENELKRWIQENPEERSDYLHVLTELELSYRNRSEAAKALAFFSESFFNSSELLILALSILNFDFQNDSINLEKQTDFIYESYHNLDLDLDKEVFIAILENYINQVDERFLPDFYNTIEAEYKGNYREFAEVLYKTSQLTTTKGFTLLLEGDNDFSIFDDPVAGLALDIVVKLYDLNIETQENTFEIEKNERLLGEAIREMYDEKNFYPDANSTMRLSYGIINGYSPQNSVHYNYYTTTKGVIEKSREYKWDSDFFVHPEIIEMLADEDFGDYISSKGEMNVCFITNNDITGGNSGSGILNAKGQLIGLAFDGNWEAMSSNLLFDPNYQRCIGVDIRYALYIMDKYSKAFHLIEELQLIKD